MYRSTRASAALTFCLLLCLAILPGTDAFASSLSVGPSHISADQPLTPGHSYGLPEHTVTNSTARALKVDVSVSDQEDDERSLPPDDWFSFSEEAVTVAPESENEVQAAVSLPDDTEPGEYRVWFRFQVDPEGSGIQVAPAVQVSFVFDVKDLTADPEPAEAEPEDYTLQVEVEGEGNTDPTPGDHTYESGSEVNITATSHDGWEFSHWQGDIAKETSSSTAVRVESDIQVVAVFREVGRELMGLEVLPSELELKVGESAQVNASGLYDDDSEESVKPSWTSADDDVVTVDDEGAVTGISEGESEIIAEFEGQECAVQVRVTGREEESNEKETAAEVADDPTNDVVEHEDSGLPWPFIGIGLAVLGGGGWALIRRYCGK